MDAGDDTANVFNQLDAMDLNQQASHLFDFQPGQQSGKRIGIDDDFELLSDLDDSSKTQRADSQYFGLQPTSKAKPMENDGASEWKAGQDLQVVVPYQPPSYHSCSDWPALKADHRRTITDEDDRERNNFEFRTFVDSKFPKVLRGSNPSTNANRNGARGRHSRDTNSSFPHMRGGFVPSDSAYDDPTHCNGRSSCRHGVGRGLTGGLDRYLRSLLGSHRPWYEQLRDYGRRDIIYQTVGAIIHESHDNGMRCRLLRELYHLTLDSGRGLDVPVFRSSRSWLDRSHNRPGWDTYRPNYSANERGRAPERRRSRERSQRRYPSERRRNDSRPERSRSPGNHGYIGRYKVTLPFRPR
jgi:hypothetical protein